MSNKSRRKIQQPPQSKPNAVTQLYLVMFCYAERGLNSNEFDEPNYFRQFAFMDQYEAGCIYSRLSLLQNAQHVTGIIVELVRNHCASSCTIDKAIAEVEASFGMDVS